MLFLDSGAFLAIERGDREVIARIKRERLAGRAPITHGGVVGQVWRGGAGRQIALARILPGVEVIPLDVALGQRAGVLLAKTKASDVIDAALAALVRDRDELLTSDPTDLRRLVRATGANVDIIRV